MTIERGEDPRDYALAAFGGAGPLHAAEVAQEIGIGTVIVPTRPGLLSAVGLLDADRRGDFSVTRLLTAAETNLPAFQAGSVILLERAAAWCAEEGLKMVDLLAEAAVDLRYEGQAFEITLPLTGAEIDRDTLATLVESFHARHKGLNGYDMPDQPIEIVTMRLGLAVQPQPATPTPLTATASEVETAIAGRREVWFAATGFVETPVFDRAKLGPGHRFAGPAIVEQTDSTTVVPPNASAEIDPLGNILIRMGGEA